MDTKAISAKNGINDIALQGHDALISAKQHKGLLLDAQCNYKGSDLGLILRLQYLTIDLKKPANAGFI